MFRNCLQRRKEQFTVEDPVIQYYLLLLLYIIICTQSTFQHLYVDSGYRFETPIVKEAFF
jgi:hypothetical protein